MLMIGVTASDRSHRLGITHTRRRDSLQISIQKDSRPSELSRPLTPITLNLNGNLPVDCRCVSLLKLPIIVCSLGEELVKTTKEASRDKFQIRLWSLVSIKPITTTTTDNFESKQSDLREGWLLNLIIALFICLGRGILPCKAWFPLHGKCHDHNTLIGFMETRLNGNQA